MVASSHGWWAGAGCWQDVSLPLHVGSTQAAWATSRHGGWLLPEQAFTRWGTSHNALYELVSEVLHYHLCLTLLFTQSGPDSVWEETTQGRGYQEAKITRGCLGDWLPHTLCIWKMALPQSQFFKILSHFQHSDQTSPFRDICPDHSTTNSPVVSLTALTIHMVFIIFYLVLKIYTYVFSFTWNLSIWRHALCHTVSTQ